jgi:hypothetical protein
VKSRCNANHSPSGLDTGIFLQQGTRGCTLEAFRLCCFLLGYWRLLYLVPKIAPIQAPFRATLTRTIFSGSRTHFPKAGLFSSKVRAAFVWHRGPRCQESATTQAPAISAQETTVSLHWKASLEPAATMGTHTSSKNKPISNAESVAASRA